MYHSFSGFLLNFDPMKEILKIRCHMHILMKKAIILKIQVTIKSFAPPFCTIERIFTPYLHLSFRFIIYSTRIGNLYRGKCQKQPLEVFCEKRCSLKFRSACEFCEIFRNTFFYRATPDDCF